MPHRQALKKGDVIHISNDDYTIERLISRGGTSLIYEAYRPYSHNNNVKGMEDGNVKRVIIKELAPHDIPFERINGCVHFQSKDIEELDEIFTQEMKNISNIQMNNLNMNRIPDMDAFGETCGTLYIAMTHIKGQLLSQYMDENEMSVDEILVKFKEMLLIVKELHKLDYFHLDLKPMNFIVGGLGSIYLFDFGSSLIKDSKIIKNLTKRYSAPEVIFDLISKVGQVSDIYSLGVILLEMLTDYVPRYEDLLFIDEKYYYPKSGEIDLNPILKKMLCEDTSKRFQNIDQVLKAIGYNIEN